MHCLPPPALQTFIGLLRVGGRALPPFIPCPSIALPIDHRDRQICAAAGGDGAGAWGNYCKHGAAGGVCQVMLTAMRGPRRSAVPPWPLPLLPVAAAAALGGPDCSRSEWNDAASH